ncbi:MAG: F0F1 ATP synthase subunit A [Alphaproteobacteria bacterium]|nr:F0F1 ATP synthase subunit A [Alphaproteobacteria bacterium]
MNPLEQFVVKEIIPLEVNGLKLSLTNSALFMLLSAFLGIGFLFFCLRKKEVIPSYMQSMAESLYCFIQRIGKEALGEKSKPYLPFLLSVFIFVFMGNILGLVPMGFSFTGQLIPVGAFALLGLIVSSLIGIYHKGFSWFQTFMPAGIPRLLAPIVIPIEMISFIAKPFSLTVRLVMNMVVGHILLDIMAYFTTVSGLAGAFPLIFVLLMMIFELGIAFLQAYIYTILTSIYLGEAVRADH